MLEQVYTLCVNDRTTHDGTMRVARFDGRVERGRGGATREKKERESATGERTGVKETAGWTRGQRSEWWKQGRTNRPRFALETRETNFLGIYRNLNYIYIIALLGNDEPVEN